MVTGEQHVISGLVKDKKAYNSENYLTKLKIQIVNLSPDLKDLIIKMLDFNPEKRPSIKNILDDPWMKEVKEDDLNQEKELFKEFERREKIIEENKNVTIQSSSEEDSKDSINIKECKSKSMKNENKNEINF